MSDRPRRRIPLARKLSLFFGAAVLLTIAATLLFPWLQMTALNEQSLLWRAKRLAAVAQLSADLHPSDWGEAQSQLDRQWPQLAEDLALSADPAPRLVTVSRIGSGFLRDAVDRLTRSAAQQYYWRIQKDGRTFRFASAVRGTDLDAHPDALRGIVDVTLAIPRLTGVWNSVVTILAGASGAVLALIAFYMITQRIVLSPVTTLRLSADRAAEGDLEVRAAIRTGDEFQDLAGAFNNMLAHLHQAQEEQRTINRSLDVKLGELAETNVALYESNRLKSEFLANVSHELRTPLVSIIGFAELLRDATQSVEIDAKRSARYAENILQSGRGLLELINDLLDLAKIEAGRLELHVTEFSLVELCGDLLDFVRPLADKRSQTLREELPHDLPRLRSDSGRIKQILFNLLSNAVKFTPIGGSITLRARPEGGDQVQLIVSDSGPGIAPDQHGVIFEKFRQLDASKTREHEGTGLGLAITRDLVHMLGGRIELHSEPGQGATFAVTLPMTTDRAAPRQPISLTG